MKKITVTKKTTAKVVGGLAKYIVLIFIFAFLLFPVYWMLVTALKTNIESYRLVPTLWPETISLDGFKTLISDGKFLVYYKNNIIVSAMAAVIICFISVFAGYALSRFHFKWNKMLLATFAFAQMMPVISRLISLYTILRKLNLTDTHIGLVLAISATQVPFTVSLMASFFDGIPGELEEAASIDGSGRFYTLFHIIMPLVVPGLLAVGVYSFLMTWDDYFQQQAVNQLKNVYALTDEANEKGFEYDASSDYDDMVTSIKSYAQQQGVSEDEYCKQAREKIKKACDAPEADVHFLVGGTQTNYVVIRSILRPYQGVISAVTGHINVHETGAVEATGHKVLALPSEDGKITASQVRAYYDAHWNDADHEHIVQPGMVYISHPTENGTIYSKSELQELYATCKELGLPLFMDGARMGYGLMSEKSDMTLADIAANTDVFYIGGTKVGALFGEAVVITKSALKKDFRYCMKQSGAMLAKGRLLGIQFDTLFTDDLYFKIAAHADKLAMKLKNAFLEKGYKMYFDSYTNQQYPILSKKDREKLAQKYQFSFWEQIDEDYAAVRFCTSWATSEEAIDELIQDI